jgi:hypothetical protein
LNYENNTNQNKGSRKPRKQQSIADYRPKPPFVAKTRPLGDNGKNSLVLDSQRLASALLP